MRISSFGGSHIRIYFLRGPHIKDLFLGYFIRNYSFGDLPSKDLLFGGAH